MDSCYAIDDIRNIVSPSLILYRDLLDANLNQMIDIAGRPERLRPHCKTHKMIEVTRRELQRGITRHKCATFAEAEMLAQAGVPDVFLSYNLVGPNIARAVAFLRKYPAANLKVQADHPAPIAELGQAMDLADLSIEVLLDVNVGQNRTGVAIGPEAEALYAQLCQTPGIRPGGLHVYDGHQHQASREERTLAVDREWDKVVVFRDKLLQQGFPIPRIVCGGTGSFPIYAAKDDPRIELSPGTCVFNDAGYTAAFPDLQFTPAVTILTRVVSRPLPDRITLDLGYKAVASDPPAGKRVVVLDLPEAEQVLQNEEHLVLRTSRASEFQPGDALFALPWHICPSTALHRQVYVVSEGKVVDRWEVTARDRCLTI
jgi:D-serine deaminase-like pyridoxal phosphate-dependent protein